MPYDHHYSRENLGYHKGWQDGQQSTTHYYAKSMASAELKKPIKRDASIKDMRAHPLGYYNVQALHMRSLKPGTTTIKWDTYLTFDKTGGHEDDGTGLAQFTIQSWAANPLITGLYQFDPDNPSKSVPILRAFTFDLSQGAVYYRCNRIMVQRFAAANGLHMWWHKDSYNGRHLLIPSKSFQVWNGYSWPKKPTKTLQRQTERIHDEYKYRIRYFRSVNKLAEDNTATFVYDGLNDTWV